MDAKYQKYHGPDQKIQTVAFAAVLFFCLERSDLNDKILLSGSNLTLGLVRNAPNLRDIRDNLPAFNTWQIYSLSPRGMNFKPSRSQRLFCNMLDFMI